VGAPETLHVRRAALLLHALPPAARQEVIAKLDADESARLEPLLAELTTLGVPPSLGQPLQRIATATATPQERAAQLSANHVVERLRDCSSTTTARLLCAAQWPWKSQVLERMSGLRRLEVEQHLGREHPKLAPGVLAALCEQLCRSSRRPSSSNLSGLFGRLIRWMQ
jgi:hypothetical protein